MNYWRMRVGNSSAHFCASITALGHIARGFGLSDTYMILYDIQYKQQCLATVPLAHNNDMMEIVLSINEENEERTPRARFTTKSNPTSFVFFK